MDLLRRMPGSDAMKHCSRCNLDIDGQFCTSCGSLTKPLERQPGEPAKGAPGETFECVIWRGATPGIRVGVPNRKRFFSIRRSRIELVLDGELCRVELGDNFWGQCPEIRVAQDAGGKNCLKAWIERKGLLAPGDSKRLRGREDRVVFEVLVPEERFGLKVKEGSGRAE
jgi:hypothetical protein